MNHPLQQSLAQEGCSRRIKIDIGLLSATRLITKRKMWMTRNAQGKRYDRVRETQRCLFTLSSALVEPSHSNQCGRQNSLPALILLPRSHVSLDIEPR